MSAWGAVVWQARYQFVGVQSFRMESNVRADWMSAIVETMMDDVVSESFDGEKRQIVKSMIKKLH